MLWGVSFVATRVALETFHPAGLIASRLVLGSCVLLLLQLASRTPLLPDASDRLRVCLLGAILGGHLLMQAFGLLHTSAIQTGWIIAVIPVMIALAGRLVLGKRLSALSWLGIAVGAAGVGVVASADMPEFENARFGDLLQLLSCVSWTVYTLAAERPVASSGALRTTSTAMIVAALMALVVASVTGWRTETAPTGGLDATGIAAVLFLGLGCNGFAFWLWMRGMARDGPARISALLYLEPFVTLGAAVVLLDEPVTTHALIGGGVVLFGVWLVGRGGRSG